LPADAISSGVGVTAWQHCDIREQSLRDASIRLHYHGSDALKIDLEQLC